MKKMRHSKKRKTKRSHKMNKLNIADSEKIIKIILGFVNGQKTDNFNKKHFGLKLKTFLIVFTVVASFMKRVTLEGLALKCQEEQYGLSMSKQALHCRLEQGRKELKELLASTITATATLKITMPQTAVVLEQFGAVLITDATTISLPEKLKKYHKGLGGTNAKSAMKIQATYDMLSKDFRKIEIIKNATQSDGKYVEKLIKEIKSGELSIADLGYYSVAGFIEIDKKGGYFISKIKSNTNLYTENGEMIDIVKMLRSKNFMDKTVEIKGAKGVKMKVRLCGVKLPKKVYSERLRKANKAAKSSGKVLSKEEKERLRWVLMVTNVPEELLDCQAICEIYRIRWQIELIFKSWKRYFGIDEMNNVGKVYWDCLIYGKLIVITMLTSLYAQMNYLIYKVSQRQISLLRFMKNMRESLDIFVQYWNFQTSEQQVVLILDEVIRSSLTEKRRRKTTEQVIADLGTPYLILEMLEAV